MSGDFFVRDINGVITRATREDEQIRIVSRRWKRENQGCWSQGQEMRIHALLVNKSDEQGEDIDKLPIWDLRMALTEYGAVASLQIPPDQKSQSRGTDYIIEFYARDVIDLFYENMTIDLHDGRSLLIKTVKKGRMTGVYWGIPGDRLWSGTEILFYWTTKGQEGVVEIEDLPPRDSARRLSFMYPSEITPKIMVFTIFSIEARRIDIYCRLGDERKRIESCPLRISLPFSSVRHGTVHVSSTTPRASTWDAELDAREKNLFWCWINTREAPKIMRAPLASDDERVSSPNFRVQQEEWLETIVHDDIPSALYARPGLSASTDQELRHWVFERLLTPILRHSGFLIRSIVPAETAEEQKRNVWDMLRRSHLVGVANMKFLRTVNPFPDQERQVLTFFRSMKEIRPYLVYGLFFVLVCNDIFPRRWIASFEDSNRQIRTRRPRATTEQMLQDLLDADIADGQVYFALQNLLDDSRRVGLVEPVIVRWRRHMAQAKRIHAQVPRDPPHHSSLYHCFITPSKMYVDGPFTELNNRVLRDYESRSHNFLRVTFASERKGEIFLNRPEKFLLLEKLRLTLYSNVIFGCDRFEFLAYGNSQLRSKSVWFVNPVTFDLQPKNVILRMGDFPRSMFPGRAAARQGQCFSSTKPAIVLESENIVYVQDVERKVFPDRVDSKSFVFTDGVGCGSLELFRQVARNLGLRKVPSALQIRYQGVKGMVSLFPEKFKPPRQSHVFLELHSSQTKFLGSPCKTLEVCDWSRPIPLSLNKQLLVLLDTLGLPRRVILDLTDSLLQDYSSFFAAKDVALRFLSFFAASSESLIPLLLQLIRFGFSPSIDSFLRSAMAHMQLWFLRSQLLEFRFPCPGAAILFGIFDEANVLQYDHGEGCPEVFIQISDCAVLTMSGGTRSSRDAFMAQRQVVVSDAIDSDNPLIRNGTVIEGYVLITKSPCLHPGDIVLCHAVNRPELSHLEDVVVFPGPGPIVHPRHPGTPNESWEGCRDIPNMMSGGDLDGDQFAIIWHGPIVQPILEAFLASDVCPNAPAAFTVPAESVPNRELAKGSVKEYFCMYQKSTNVGVIASTWLKAVHQPSIYAARKAFAEPCIKLAELHSDAVDFGKTGKPAEIGSLRYPDVPHFLINPAQSRVMGKAARRKIFFSDSLLGNVFDLINRVWQEELADSCRVQVKPICPFVVTEPTPSSGALLFLARGDRAAVFTAAGTSTPEMQSHNRSSTKSHFCLTKFRSDSSFAEHCRMLIRVEWLNAGSVLTHNFDHIEIIMHIKTGWDLSRKCVERAEDFRILLVSPSPSLFDLSKKTGPDYELLESIPRNSLLEISERAEATTGDFVLLLAAPPYVQASAPIVPSRFIITIEGVTNGVSIQLASSAVVDLPSTYPGWLSGPPNLEWLRTLPLRQPQPPREENDAPPIGLFGNKVLWEKPPPRQFPLLMKSRWLEALLNFSRVISARKWLLSRNVQEEESQLDYLTLLIRASPFLEHFAVYQPSSEGFLALFYPACGRRLEFEPQPLLPLRDLDDVWLIGLRPIWRRRIPCSPMRLSTRLLASHVAPLLQSARFSKEPIELIFSRFFGFEAHPAQCLPFDQEFVEIPRNLVVGVPADVRERLRLYLWLPTHEALTRTGAVADSPLDELDHYPLGVFDRSVKDASAVTCKYDELRKALMAVNAEHLPTPRMAQWRCAFKVLESAKGERLFNRHACPSLCRREGGVSPLSFSLRRELLHPDFPRHLEFAIKLREAFVTQASANMSALGLQPCVDELQFISACFFKDIGGIRGDREERARYCIANLRQQLIRDACKKRLSDAVSSEDAFCLNGDEMEARASAIYVVSALNLRLAERWSPFVFFDLEQAEATPTATEKQTALNFERKVLALLQQPSETFPYFSSFPWLAVGNTLCLMEDNFFRWYERERALQRTKSAMWHMICEKTTDNSLGECLEQLRDKVDLEEMPNIELDEAKHFKISRVSCVNPLQACAEVTQATASFWNGTLRDEFEKVYEIEKRARPHGSLRVDWPLSDAEFRITDELITEIKSDETETTQAELDYLDGLIVEA